MVDLTPADMASKLTVEGFSRTGPVAQEASDPIVETPMVVTLDDLRPYELDPRLTRNPLYDDIKASIRERGLDAPPAITRRPGADHYIIRNGGNTRLAILRELWSETKDERFFRIACLFRPWPERGEIVALTGHLAENELHGGLTFIERAIGVDKARELYEQASGKSLTQADLARHLSADGYPISQSQISRMQDALRYLLPCIPNLLYQGLGRRQIDRLTTLRNAAESLWKKQPVATSLPTDFESLFHEVLAPFDIVPEAFAIERVQDELIGQMAKLLGVHYNVLELDIDNVEQRQRAVSQPAPSDTPPVTPQSPAPRADTPHESVAHRDTPAPVRRDDDNAARVQNHIVSPAASTERLQAIQQLVAEHTGEEAPPSFADQALRAIPVQAGGLFPISDVWYIEPGLDSPAPLRIHIAQFAREIAAEADLIDRIDAVNAGIGFTCAPLQEGHSWVAAFGHTVLALLRALSVHYAAESALADRDGIALNHTLGGLLLGSDSVDTEAMPRLSDNGLVKLFRLIRLARRLLDLEALPDDANS